jgi:hypothetical protein
MWASSERIHKSVSAYLRHWNDHFDLILSDEGQSLCWHRAGLVLRSTTDQYCGAHRGGEYALAAAVALPNAIQVADRWGMPAVPLSTRPGNPCGEIPAAIGITTINSRLLTATERIQYEGYLRREETNGAILARRRTGPPLGRSWSHRT